MQCSIAVLQGVSIQAVVTEFLVRNADTLFTDSVLSDSTDVVTGQWNYEFTAVILTNKTL